MIKRTRNILTPDNMLHVYEVYDDDSTRLIDILPVKYIIMGEVVESPLDASNMFGMSSDWFYRRLNRYWASANGFPATWCELVGAAASDFRVIEEAKCATLEATAGCISARISNISATGLTSLLLRARRVTRVFRPLVERCHG